MSGWHILQAVLSLVVVLGLLLLTFWTIKYCEVKGLKSRFMRRLTAGQRLEVGEIRQLDAKNRLVLVKNGKREYLLLLSNGQNLLVDKYLTEYEETDD